MNLPEFLKFFLCICPNFHCFGEGGGDNCVSSPPPVLYAYGEYLFKKLSIFETLSNFGQWKFWVTIHVSVLLGALFYSGFWVKILRDSLQILMQCSPNMWILWQLPDVLFAFFFRLDWFYSYLPHICFSSCRGLYVQSTWIFLVYVNVQCLLLFITRYHAVRTKHELCFSYFFNPDWNINKFFFNSFYHHSARIFQKVFWFCSWCALQCKRLGFSGYVIYFTICF